MLGVGGTDPGQEQQSVALYTEASVAMQQEPAFAGGGTRRDRGQGWVRPGSGSEAPAGGGLLRVPWGCLGAPGEFRTERKALETFLCTEVPRPVRRALPWERGSKPRPRPGASRRTSRATGSHQGQRRSHMGKQTEEIALTPGQVESPRHRDGGRPA